MYPTLTAHDGHREFANPPVLFVKFAYLVLFVKTVMLLMVRGWMESVGSGKASTPTDHDLSLRDSSV